MPRERPQTVDFKLTSERVETPPEQRDQLADGMRILATWLLRHHRKVVGAPKDNSE
jgi:hypothetical protein